MKVIIELNAGDSQKYNNKLLTKIAQETIMSSGILVHTNTTVTISVAIVSENEIQKVNNQLRGKNMVTDVISIGEYSDENDISVVRDDKIFLGEVILCYNYIEQLTQQDDSSVDKEFFIVYSHGILHLLGFQHGNDMFQLQELVASKFCKL